MIEPYSCLRRGSARPRRLSLRVDGRSEGGGGKRPDRGTTMAHMQPMHTWAPHLISRTHDVCVPDGHLSVLLGTRARRHRVKHTAHRQTRVGLRVDQQQRRLAVPIHTLWHRQVFCGEPAFDRAVFVMQAAVNQIDGGLPPTGACGGKGISCAWKKPRAVSDHERNSWRCGQASCYGGAIARRLCSQMSKSLFRSHSIFAD
jgi:hypothetical protein